MRAVRLLGRIAQCDNSRNSFGIGQRKYLGQLVAVNDTHYNAADAHIMRSKAECLSGNACVIHFPTVAQRSGEASVTLISAYALYYALNGNAAAVSDNVMVVGKAIYSLISGLFNESLVCDDVPSGGLRVFPRGSIGSRTDYLVDSFL